MATTQHVDHQHTLADERKRRPRRTARSTPSERRLARLGLALAAVLPLWLAGPLAGVAAAQTQSVAPSVSNQVKAANQPVAITFRYNATSNNTTGLGLRIHYNSNKLTNPSFTGIFGGAGGGSLFVMGPSEDEVDTANLDGDTNTDRILLLAWVHTLSAFTGGSLPTDLFTVNFMTSGSFSGSTAVRITAVDTASGFGFSSTPATVTAPGAPTPTPTPTPPVPTPTPTSTPGATAILDVDGNGEAKPLTDGILIVRWMVGFTGDALISNAVANPGCTRCTASQITNYLNGIETILDIDDNGETKPLTDGVLIVRWLVGFTGNSLISNAVATQPPVCQRCDATSIQLYLSGLD
jgi:hypothetical protein